MTRRLRVLCLSMMALTLAGTASAQATPPSVVDCTMALIVDEQAWAGASVQVGEEIAFCVLSKLLTLEPSGAHRFDASESEPQRDTPRAAMLECEQLTECQFPRKLLSAMLEHVVAFDSSDPVMNATIIVWADMIFWSQVPDASS